ncbi:hypothetical protein BDR06DRAFT_895603, partial [Suillus hirtellus]
PSMIIDSGGRIIVWYLPGTMTGMLMVCHLWAFMLYCISSGITTSKPTEWRTHMSNFYPSLDGKITPGCINISLAWFQQGRKVYGFSPNVSATLKGVNGHNITVSLQRSGILVSTALWMMHPDLYLAGIKTHVRLGEWASRHQLHDMCYHLQCWTSVFNVVSVICNCQSPPHRDPKCQPEAFDIMTTTGIYHPVIMDFINLGIKILYNSGSMLASSCQLVRHHMHVEEGNWIVTAWYMQDSIHNFVGTPRTEYAKYGNARYSDPVEKSACV